MFNSIGILTRTRLPEPGLRQFCVANRISSVFQNILSMKNVCKQHEMPFTGRLVYMFGNLSWFAHPRFHTGMIKEPSWTQNKKNLG